VTADAPIEKKPIPSGGICHLCRHLDRNAPVGMSCAAFPRGIPFPVRIGVFDHRNPHPADGGIQFEPTDEAAGEASAWRSPRS
jgi:hypothetical protein